MAEIGDTLGGRYRLVELLGQGGMATIYRAVDTQLGRDVAVKVLRPEYVRDPDFSSRFRQEAQAAASLSHPNVVTVYDYGTDASGPFIVMELVDGEDLATILKSSGALPPRQAARIGSAGRASARRGARARPRPSRRQARQHPHQPRRPGEGRRLRHRPGVAEAQLTLPGTTLGSVHYFSPEQARGEPATAASDIYSPRHRAVRDAHRRPAVRGRQRRGDRARPAVRPGAGPDPGPRQRAVRARGDHPAGPGRRPAARFSSAGSMADALDATLDPNAGARAAALAGAATVAAAAGIASANPNGVPYDEDAYATARLEDPAPAPVAPIAGRRRDRRRPRTRSSGSPASSPSCCSRPSPTWSSSSSAAVTGTSPTTEVDRPELRRPAAQRGRRTRPAEDLEIVLQSDARGMSEQHAGPDPGAGLRSRRHRRGRGGDGQVTVAAEVGTVPVPDLRTLTEQEAVQAIADAGLSVGVRTEAFDPLVADRTRSSPRARRPASSSPS